MFHVKRGFALKSLRHGFHSACPICQRALGNDGDLAASIRCVHVDCLPAFHTPLIQRRFDLFILGPKDTANRLNAIFPLF